MPPSVSSCHRASLHQTEGYCFSFERFAAQKIMQNIIDTCRKVGKLRPYATEGQDGRS